MNINDSLFIARAFPKADPVVVDQQHIAQIKRLLKAYEGEEAAKTWRDRAKFYSPEEARAKFNADEAFRYTMELRPEDYYQKNFKHVTMLLIQKKGRGYLGIYCFYTDKAKAKLESYWRQVESIFHYER